MNVLSPAAFSHKANPYRFTDDPGAVALETGRTRLLVLCVLVMLAFAIVMIRLLNIGIVGPAYSSSHIKTASVKEAVTSPRGAIVDRNGVLLATTLRTVSLSANPAKVTDPYEAAAQLVNLFPDMEIEEALHKLSSSRKFVWLHHRVTPSQQSIINSWGIPGLEFHTEETRVYPHGPLLAHVLGSANIDNRGIAGVEWKFNELLSQGQELALTIDVRIQHILWEELNRAVKTFKAKGGAGVILDTRNGEILSLVSLPDFDPNHISQFPKNTLFNKATLGVYELGSPFKIFNTALALETGAVTLATQVDATTPLQVARYAIHDYHAQNRRLSVPEVFIHSSNIGSARIAERIGSKIQKDFLDQLGLLSPADVELPEVGRPQYPNHWRPVNTMTISFGHGISISPLQLASGVSAMVNGGILYKPTLLANGTPDEGRRIISPKTSAIMRSLMYLNNLEGSGTKGNASGYLVGGKTGSAEKTDSTGNYQSNRLISSYIAAFPMSNPRYVVYVMLDEPQGNDSTYGYATGGWVAAPAVGHIVQRMAPLVGLQPIAPNAPEARHILALGKPYKKPNLALYKTQYDRAGYD